METLAEILSARVAVLARVVQIGPLRAREEESRHHLFMYRVSAFATAEPGYRGETAPHYEYALRIEGQCCLALSRASSAWTPAIA